MAEPNPVTAETATRLLARLDWLRLRPQRVLLIDRGDDGARATLQKRYPEAAIMTVNGIESSRLPELPNGPFELVISNLCVPWWRDLQFAFDSIQQVMAPGAALLYTAAGPGTLNEYAEVWSAAGDSHAHCFGLHDMPDLGVAMQRAGLADVVLDRENLTVDYPSLAALEAELRAQGAANRAPARRRGLIGRDRLDAVRECAGLGRFEVTLELIQGHGWHSERRTEGPVGEVRVPLESIGGRSRV